VLFFSSPPPRAYFPSVGPPPPRDRVLREAPLEQAQESLRPVRELIWEQDGLHLRLTGQGPWTADDLLAIAASVGG
jgi:hypothetical protein